MDLITEDQAQQYYDNNDSAHSFEHVKRVVAIARRIAEAEGADLRIVQSAALLHDIGRAEQSRTGVCHAEVGARRAREILQGYPVEFVEAVVHAISAHRYRDKQNVPQSLEAKVLFDADKLDALGAIGVGRAYAMAGQRGQKLWSPLHTAAADDLSSAIAGQPEDHTPVQEYLFKLRYLRETMFTATGRRLAADRHAFMVSFFERLDREVYGLL